MNHLYLNQAMTNCTNKAEEGNKKIRKNITRVMKKKKEKMKKNESQAD